MLNNGKTREMLSAMVQIGRILENQGSTDARMGRPAAAPDHFVEWTRSQMPAADPEKLEAIGEYAFRCYARGYTEVMTEE